MRGGRIFGVLVVCAMVGCGEAYPQREFDCAALAEAYAGCAGHLGISAETAVCQVVFDRQNGVLAPSIDRAAQVCEEVAGDLAAPDSCDAMFVCLDDEHGLSAVARGVQVAGTAEVEGVAFGLAATDGWAWVGTKASGDAGDFEVLFLADGRRWYFRLEDFTERATSEPFAVDVGRPIKLEDSEDNVELAVGTVTVEAFALNGAFDVAASGTDPVTGETVEIRLTGSFAAGE